MRFILASKSPSRLELLRRAGLDPEVHASDVDESLITEPQPGPRVEAVQRRAEEVPVHEYIALARQALGRAPAARP